MHAGERRNLAPERTEIAAVPLYDVAHVRNRNACFACRGEHAFRVRDRPRHRIASEHGRIDERLLQVDDEERRGNADPSLPPNDWAR